MVGTPAFVGATFTVALMGVHGLFTESNFMKYLTPFLSKFYTQLTVFTSKMR
jgi:hypothetical protein